MKRFYLLLLLLVCAITSQAATIDTLQINSPKMGRDIATLVVVPQSDSAEPMPVLYLLHGYNGRETTWMNIRDLRPLADENKMIIVCPAGENSWYWDSPKVKDSQFESFISRELPAYIDSNYNTVADRTGRAITGLSMGGHGAIYNALRNKDVFGAAGSTSGGLDIRPFPESWKMSVQIGEAAQNSELWERHTAINNIGKLKDGELAIIIDCGVGDFFLEVNRNFHQALVDAGVSHDYIERAGKHTGDYWCNSLPYQVFYFDRYFDTQAELRRLRREAIETGIATIDNGQQRVQVSCRGAELISIQDKRTGYEYLWQGDATYWRFRAPVLFPIVGAVCNDTYKIGDKSYDMTIHGIARDYDFELIKHTQTEVVYRLKSSEAMKKNYPYDFILEIGYRFTGAGLRVSHKVTNPSDETINFQIGAHPGFNFKGFDPNAPVQGYLSFNDKSDKDKLLVDCYDKAGFTTGKKRSITLSDKKLPITKNTFDSGALILEGEQTKDISLLDADGKAYVRVRCDSPVVGLWSNAKGGYAPFVCIEPWYGVCDSSAYKGEFKDKAWMQTLQPKGVFQSAIVIGVFR